MKTTHYGAEKGHVVEKSIPVRELPETFADQKSKVAYGQALQNPKTGRK